MGPFLASALFCETIRSEVSGQDTLIGTFPDNVNIAIPGLMPSLAVYVRMSFDPDDPTGRIDVVVTLPNGETVTNDVELSVIEKAKKDAKASGNPLATILSRVQFLNLSIPRPGRITVVLNIDGATHTLATLNFQASPTSATPATTDLA